MLFYLISLDGYVISYQLNVTCSSQLKYRFDVRMDAYHEFYIHLSDLFILGYAFHLN